MTEAATLERLALDAGPNDPVDLSAALQRSDFEATAAPGAEEAPEPAAFQPISEELFLQRWVSVHAVAGGMLSPKGGPVADLAGLALDEGGQMAGKGFYQLCMSSPFAQKAFLSSEMGTLGCIVAIGMHGMACRAVVRDARAEAARLQSMENGQAQG